jgi:Ca2+-binding EF-hand superfamily protein
MIRAIGTFDTHGSGLISIQELRFSTLERDQCYGDALLSFPMLFLFLRSLVLTGLGDKLSDAEFDSLRVFMRTGDGNGQISYERTTIIPGTDPLTCNVEFISNVLKA